MELAALELGFTFKSVGEFRQVLERYLNRADGKG
jgi:hypothetical protein